MIRTEHGIVEIQGDATDIFADFTSVVGAVMDTLTQGFDEEFANQMIALCGKLAVYHRKNDGTPSDDHDITKEFHEIQKEYIKRKNKRECGLDGNK